MRRNGRVVTNSRLRNGKKERGIALVTALLLLALLTGMSLAMYLTVNSDMLTNKYYRNFQGSFYAADSGLTIIRQDMSNKLLLKIDPSTNKDNPPYSDATLAVVVNSLKSSWANSYKSLNTGVATASATEKFILDSGTLQVGFKDPSKPCLASATTWTCELFYQFVSIGQADGLQKNRIMEQGTVFLNVPFDKVPPPYFSGYGLYIENQDVCPGSIFAPGTITGPVATEGCFTFGTGNYIFTNNVACNGATAGFQFSSTCIKSGTPSYTYGTGRNRVTIAPTFQDGINFGAKMPDLPSDDYQQKRAVIDGIGLNPDQVTNTDLAKLRDFQGNSYSNQKTGVFFNYKDENTFLGGGFYVPSSADVTLSTAMVPALTGSDPKSGVAYPPCPGGTPSCYLQQKYTITTGGVVTEITVTAAPNPDYDKAFPNDPAYSYTMTGIGQTQVKVGNNTLTIHDVPTQKDNTGTYDLNNAVMLYVDGQVNSLSGQIQDDAAITITAASNITVTGNVTYKTPPVVQNTSDALIDGNDRGQVLGLFTNTGNIQLNNKVKNGTIEIDASMATISGKQNASGGITSIGQDISKLTIVGGRIHNSLHTANVASRDVFFDKRFLQGLYPPFFPATKKSTTTLNPDAPSVSFNRTTWVSMTAY